MRTEQKSIKRCAPTKPVAIGQDLQKLIEIRRRLNMLAIHVTSWIEILVDTMNTGKSWKTARRTMRRMQMLRIRMRTVAFGLKVLRICVGKMSHCHLQQCVQSYCVHSNIRPNCLSILQCRMPTCRVPYQTWYCPPTRSLDTSEPTYGEPST